MTSLVQRNLPNASNGRGGNLIAKNDTSVAPAGASASASFASGMPNLPHTGPMPDPRYTGVAQAYAAPQVGNAASAALDTLPRPRRPLPFRFRSRRLPIFPTRVPPWRRRSRHNRSRPASATPPDVDSMTTARLPPLPAGWFRSARRLTRTLAMDLLRSAQERGGQVLRSATPFTVAYGDGAQQIYRARFGGFDDQKDAVNACKA